MSRLDNRSIWYTYTYIWNILLFSLLFYKSPVELEIMCVCSPVILSKQIPVVLLAATIYTLCYGRLYLHTTTSSYCREIESWAGAKMANPVLDPANFSIENFILDCRHKGRDWKGFKIIMLFALIIVMMRHKGAEHFLWDRFYRSLFMSAIECTYHGDWAHGDFEYAR